MCQNDIPILCDIVTNLSVLNVSPQR